MILNSKKMMNFWRMLILYLFWSVLFGCHGIWLHNQTNNRSLGSVVARCFSDYKHTYKAVFCYYHRPKPLSLIRLFFPKISTFKRARTHTQTCIHAQKGAIIYNLCSYASMRSYHYMKASRCLSFMGPEQSRQHVHIYVAMRTPIPDQL